MYKSNLEGQALIKCWCSFSKGLGLAELEEKGRQFTEKHDLYYVVMKHSRGPVSTLTPAGRLSLYPCSAGLTPFQQPNFIERTLLCNHISYKETLVYKLTTP